MLDIDDARCYILGAIGGRSTLEESRCAKPRDEVGEN